MWDDEFVRPTSRYRYVELSDLFSAGKVLDCHLARVCVLYEDLRLESTALYDDEFLVRSGVKPFKFNAQKTYFLRRVIGTIREYVEVVRLIDQCEEFQLLKSKFSPETSVKWQEALDRCRETEKFLKLVRNDVSGHFGYAAAKYGVKSVAERRGIGGMIEYRDPRIDQLGVGTNKSSPRLKGKLPHYCPIISLIESVGWRDGVVEVGNRGPPTPVKAAFSRSWVST